MSYVIHNICFDTRVGVVHVDATAKRKLGGEKKEMDVENGNRRLLYVNPMSEVGDKFLGKVV